jgi:molybdate transport system substrate-binding protein
MKWMRFIVLVLSLALTASAQQLTIAAAADLQFAFRDLSSKFETQTGIPVRVTYGSSGNFATQIENGAPFDLFFSADLTYPQKLLREGLAEGPPYRYANGKLVLWVPANSKLDLSKGLQALLDPSIQKIAIANPQHAPYGRAAVQAMKSTGVHEKLATKFILGENISQTAQFLESGTAEAGFVALSLALSPAMRARGRYVEVPQNAYSAIEQAAVIVKQSSRKAECARFLEFMKSPEARAVMQAYGFVVPAR